MRNPEQMKTHAPDGWDCPFCRIAHGEEIAGPWVKRCDLVYRDPDLTAFISPHRWPTNPGHALIIPNEHHENLYLMPDDLLAEVATPSTLARLEVAAPAPEGLS